MVSVVRWMSSTHDLLEVLAKERIVDLDGGWGGLSIGHWSLVRR